MNERLYIAIPSRDNRIDARVVEELTKVRAAFPGSGWCCHCCSLLAMSFNQLWCNALNLREHGLTHFLMLHDDIVPTSGQFDTHWSRVMLDEMEDLRLGVLSVTMPLRGGIPETSAAIDGKPPHRMSMKEWPANRTLTSDAEPNLLINTGLMLVDMRRPWVEEFAFAMEDRIEKVDGQFVPVTLPEDWKMSRWLKKRGIRFATTTRVQALHVGTHGWSNIYGSV